MMGDADLKFLVSLDFPNFFFLYLSMFFLDFIIRSSPGMLFSYQLWLFFNRMEFFTTVIRLRSPVVVYRGSVDICSINLY